MGGEDLELHRLLFVAATTHLEEAHELAVMGQGAGLTVKEYSELARRLGKSVQSVVALAEAVMVVAEIASGDGEELALDCR